MTKAPLVTYKILNLTSMSVNVYIDVSNDHILCCLIKEYDMANHNIFTIKRR